MEAIKTRRLVQLINDLAIGKIIWMPTTQEIDEVMVEVMALEYRAKEFDKRETGVQVLVREISPTRVHQCGNCGEVLPVTLKMKYYNYCSHCGYRLIHQEPETYTVQINGKDVVLQKGEDYVVIPKKEILYR